MTPDQIACIRATWNTGAPSGDRTARLFYERLFALDPSLEPLFAHVDAPRQRERLLQVLSTVVDRLDDLDSIVPAVEDLGRRHVGYGVQDGHYETVGAALLWALEQALGEAWTAEAESAWTTAYGVLSGVMCGAAREVEAGWGPSHFAQSPSPAPGSSRSGRPLRSERAASPAA